MQMLVAVTVLALVVGIIAGRWWWRMEFSDWDAGRAVVWLIDTDGLPIPTRLCSTDRRQARVVVESLGDGDTIGLGLRFDDGRVVSHHFGRELPLSRQDQLSIPLPRAFLPGKAA